MSQSLTIDRSSLSASDLVISDDASTGLWLPEDGIGKPAMSWRRTYAPPSPWLHGSTLLAAVKEQSSIPATVYLQGDSAASLSTLEDTLAEALSQFAYDVTLTVDGQAQTFAADPADWSFGTVDSGMARAFMSRATVTIPVYPIPGA